jgi:hypothetical protein
MVVSINKAHNGYKSLRYENTRIVLLDRERFKIQIALVQFIDEWADSGVFVVSHGWTNVRNRCLLNVLGVLASGTMFLAVHDFSSITSYFENFIGFLLNH